MDRRPDETRFDVLIAGLGIPGATLALALAKSGLRVAAVDATALETRLAPEFDGRASAVAYANMRLWRALGVAEAMQADAQPITSILVSDMSAPGAASRRPAPVFLRFDTEEPLPSSSPSMGEDGTRSRSEWGGGGASDIAAGTQDSHPHPPTAFGRGPLPPPSRGRGEPLGWMVENRRIRSVLAAALEAAGVRVVAPARVTSLQVDARRARLGLDDGSLLEASLVIGAEGRRSTVREAAGIGVNGWTYPQVGVVATVALERPHEGVAHEIFLPGGPLAVLPMTGDRANLVWTERGARAQALVAASPEAFEAHLARRFGEALGRPRLIGSRHAHPLSLQMAERMVAPRVALVGDAAHAIHPLAGQGLNLGLKDAAALAEVVVEAQRLGEDVGAETVLERYARWRRFDRAGLAMATDLFTRLFSNDDPLTRLARGAGLALVNRSTTAKRLFTREAGGDLGDLPRLLRGEAL